MEVAVAFVVLDLELTELWNRSFDGDRILEVDLTAAKEIAPDQPMVADTLGWALYRKGMYRSAVVHLEDAVSKSDHNPMTRYHLAMAYLKAGDRDRGRQALEAALRMDPKTAEAKMALETLRELQQQGNGH